MYDWFDDWESKKLFIADLGLTEEERRKCRMPYFGEFGEPLFTESESESLGKGDFEYSPGGERSEGDSDLGSVSVHGDEELDSGRGPMPTSATAGRIRGI
jgi:hypothetical protein